MYDVLKNNKSLPFFHLTIFRNFFTHLKKSRYWTLQSGRKSFFLNWFFLTCFPIYWNFFFANRYFFLLKSSIPGLSRLSNKYLFIYGIRVYTLNYRCRCGSTKIIGLKRSYYWKYEWTKSSGYDSYPVDNCVCKHVFFSKSFTKNNINLVV